MKGNLLQSSCFDIDSLKKSISLWQSDKLKLFPFLCVPLLYEEIIACDGINSSIRDLEKNTFGNILFAPGSSL